MSIAFWIIRAAELLPMKRGAAGSSAWSVA
jgi:hypothetical protein